MFIVNSFPRTGNKFLIFCAEEYLDVPTFLTNDSDLHNVLLLEKKEIDQVVIFRKTKDTLISFFILKMFLNHKDTKWDTCINEFKNWNEEFAKNIDHLYPLTFEQITKNTLQSLDYISDTFEIKKKQGDKVLYLQDMLKKKDGGWNNLKNIQQSSKNHIKYTDIMNDYTQINPSVIAELEDMELYMRKLIKKRQNELGWNLPN